MGSGSGNTGAICGLNWSINRLNQSISYLAKRLVQILQQAKLFL